MEWFDNSNQLYRFVHYMMSDSFVRAFASSVLRSANSSFSSLEPPVANITVGMRIKMMCECIAISLFENRERAILSLLQI